MLWEGLLREAPDDVDARYGLLYALADPERAPPLKAPVRAVTVGREIVARSAEQARWARERKYTLYWLARAASDGHPALASTPRREWLGWLDEACALAGDCRDSNDLPIARLAIRARRSAGERGEARGRLIDLIARLATHMHPAQLAAAVVDLRGDAEDLGVALPVPPRAPVWLPVEADVAALASEAQGASLCGIDPYVWRGGPSVLAERASGEPWLARVFACAARPDAAALQAMAAIRAAEWGLAEHEPVIRGLVAATSESRYLVDLALASARLLPRGDTRWETTAVDVEADPPAFAAAVLSARLLLLPEDPATLAAVAGLWRRCRTGGATIDYATGSVFFGPALALRFAGVRAPRAIAAEVRAIVDREIEGTRAEGLEEQALWTIFWALDPRYG